MRRIVFVILVSSLLVTLIFVRTGNIPAVKASSSIYQGDLLLNGNNVTVIENERFDINGSIIVEENATLILRNAVLNFLRVESYQSNMTFQNPANGNPHLIVENATITTDNTYYQRIHFYGNSSASIYDLTTVGQILLHLHDSSVASISNSTMRFLDLAGDSVADISNSILSEGIIAYGSSNLNIFNITLPDLISNDMSSVDVSNSTIYEYIYTEANSANCSVNGLQPGFISYWNFELNSSVSVAPTGSASNFTLTDTEVGGWSFKFWGSSNATITKSELYKVRPDGSSVVRVYDSSFSYGVTSYGSSSTYIYNSTIDRFLIYDSSSASVSNSTAGSIYTQHFSVLTASNSTINTFVSLSPFSANYSVTRHEPSLVGYWNFEQNCSVVLAPGGKAPNVTLEDTQVGGWGFYSRGNSNATISDSELYVLWANDFAAVSVYNSAISINLWSYDSSHWHLYNTTTQGLRSYQNSRLWLVNSTSNTYTIGGQSEVYVSWYLDARAIDSISQDVPTANVTATYPNATTAESQLTNVNGWAKLTLMEKMMNATGGYPVGNYTVTARYETHEGQQSVNMTGNQQITIQLPFIIPEFSVALMLPLFTIATLLVVVVFRRKHSM